MTQHIKEVTKIHSNHNDNRCYIVYVWNFFLDAWGFGFRESFVEVRIWAAQNKTFLLYEVSQILSD